MESILQKSALVAAKATPKAKTAQTESNAECLTCGWG